MRRKIVHMLIGCLIVFLLNTHDSMGLRFWLFIALVAGLGISLLSLVVRIPVVYHLLHLFDKKKDLEKFPGKGAFFFLAGSLFSILLFERDVASAAIMILTFGDSISHIVGKYYGRTKSPLHREKLLEGTLAGIAAGTVAASFFVPISHAFLAACISMLVEAVELEYLNLDDNLFVPLVAGLIMTALTVML